MWRIALLVALALAGCAGTRGAPDAVTCGAGELACVEGCIDPMIDPAHCGNCETTCSADEECRAGTCQVPCQNSLTAPVLDRWGYAWDGAERAAATADEALAACSGFSGRLPTVTELYRVRAGATGIATGADTNPLWSSTPSARTNQVTVALANGAVAEVAATTPTPYRCVCSPSAPAYFAGPRCNGPPGSACYPVGDVNVDNQDRPPLRKGAAIFECATERAHLADVNTLVEALEKGLLGSGAQLLTADQSRYDLTTTMAWTTATWAAAGNMSYLDTTTPAPFRCAGYGFATGTHPNPVLDEFVGANGYKGDANNHPATDWASAHDVCTMRGGHFGRSAELAELIMGGMPNGSGSPIITSDEVGYNGEQFLGATLIWTAADPRFPYDYGATGTTSWDYKTGSMPFRCIYYPLDPGYPAPTTCAGGCFTLALPAGNPPTMWFDSMDRPAALYAGAVDACRREGGHVASERDYTEAIRAGLPNGTGAWLLSSDFGIGNVMVVRWNGTETAYTDQHSTYMTWADLTTPYAFRCMWTNELR
jgi:hypothetical protein